MALKFTDTEFLEVRGPGRTRNGIRVVLHHADQKMSSARRLNQNAILPPGDSLQKFRSIFQIKLRLNPAAASGNLPQSFILRHKKTAQLSRFLNLQSHLANYFHQCEMFHRAIWRVFAKS